MNLDPDFTPYIEINLKCIRCNIKTKIIKLLEENTEINLCDLEVGSNYLGHKRQKSNKKMVNWLLSK